MKRLNISENLLFVTDDNFQLSLDDDMEYQFGVLFETLDISDFDEDADENYPFVVSAGIMVANPHESFGEGEAEYINQASLIYDCNSYMGSIPVDHVLSTEIAAGKDKVGDAFEQLAKQFTVFEAKVCENSHDFGTIAAQRGRGAKFQYLAFKNEEAAEKYIDLLIQRMPVLSMMIGFILDRPINMAGDTGWKQIETMIKGKE